MKLRDKDTRKVSFWITNARNGRRLTIDLHEYLSSKQRSRMGSRPDMALQFAHDLSERLERQEKGPVEVRIESLSSLNRREPQPLFDARDYPLVYSRISSFRTSTTDPWWCC